MNGPVLMLLCLCMGISGASAQTAAPGPFAFEELLAIPAVRGVATAEDGTVAWIEQTRGIWNIFLAEAPQYEARQVTGYDTDDGAEIKLVGFVPGRSHLLFVRGKAGFNPAHLPDPPVPMVFVLSLRDGDVKRLDLGESAFGDDLVISPDGNRLFVPKGGAVWSYALSGEAAPLRLFATRGALGDLLLSPDGTKLAFTSDRSGYDRGKYAFVGVFDLNTRRLVYMTPGVGIDQSPVWSPGSDKIAFIRFGYEPRTWRFSNHREGAPFSVVVADALSGLGHPVWTSDVGYGARFNGFRASGYSGLGGEGNLLWMADDTLVFPYEKTGWKLLYGVSTSGGDARLLTPGDFEIDGAVQSPDRQSIIYWANSESEPHRLGLYRMALRNGLKPRRVAAGEPGMRSKAQFVKNGAMLYVHASAPVPERLMIRTEKNDEIQLSTGPRPGDPITRKAGDAEVVIYDSFDGMKIPAVLWRPRKIGKGCPVVVHAHGGPRDKVYPVWNAFFGYPQILQYYRSRGCVVLSVNYRSGIGYGLDFREPERYGGRGADDARDFIAAAEYLKAHIPEIDPGRIVAFGHSYGGHIVTNALARSDVFALGVVSAGVGDWVVEMEKDFNEPLQFNIPQRLELERLAYESSAISKIEQWGREPVLFLHGDNDGSAAMQQTLELYLALQKRGKTVDAFIMPGEAHSIRLYRNQIGYLKKIDAFIEKTLRASARARKNQAN